jgi:predicted  nucleic acid-binding Zn-ribbon protein
MTKSRKPKTPIKGNRSKDSGMDFEIEISAPKSRSGTAAVDHTQVKIDRLEARLEKVQEWLDKLQSQVRVAKDNRSIILSEESMDDLQDILDGKQDDGSNEGDD